MKGNRLIIVLSVVAMTAAVALPAGAAPPTTSQFTLTECVLATGPPAVFERTGNDAQVLHIRGFPYLGFLTDEGGNLTGTNSGLVSIDENLKNGTGSIRGTLQIRDAVLGDFDGSFSAHYRDFVWQGRGAATGVGESAGKLLKMQVTGLDPAAVCGDPPVPEIDWSDAAAWSVTITEK
ncbi:MAG: hypothetical protein HKO63_03100 [Acidimicrobiia bacterium]|nr:hypothetical protein [Acidimicrobiia bacterium]MBT8192404.1 hypothetical protein [Acidimicrobiia bacterium]MBT8246847.1 hypothetical protein [Acidimicrobiia bacterium]NNF87259.1 hypothetical protein [Acidimicrobiia bacterium]NNJ47758.1 hypothetical protein [Acidimicrobiia bacterium]